MIKDFVIPLDKDDLLTSSAGRYTVEEVIPLRMVPQALDTAKTALQSDGVEFILNHFDTFFSLLVHGKKVEHTYMTRGFVRLTKAVEMLVNDMEAMFEQRKEISEDKRLELLCINKMLAYLFSSFICYIDNWVVKNSSDGDISGKRKKAPKTDMEEEWEGDRQKALEFIYRWLQLPLQQLWQPPIVEDSFITLFTQACYKILEQSKDPKQKHVRQTIFEILGTLVKRYNHGITCVIRIIQLVKLYDSIAPHIATGVVHMITDCGCNGLLKEVINEIGRNPPGETDSRNMSIFLETVAVSKPDLIIPLLDDITDYLASEYYTMRNCIIEVLGAVVEKALTAEDLTEEQKQQRDECLNNLEDHILDCNAYVRSKVLNVWQRLCCNGAVPLSRQGNLLAATSLRLEDKSANVRKQALQLMRALLQSNPFASKLNRAELSKSLETEKANLKKLQIQLVSESAAGDQERLQLWNTLVPDIQKALKKIFEDENDKENRNETQDEEIDPNSVFENIRQLLLSEKVFDAVSYLWKACTKIKKIPDMTTLDTEAKEECLFVFLLRIFMESENGEKNETTNDKSTAKDAAGDSKLKEEIIRQKRVVNYLKDCLNFANEMEAAIPKAEHLLFSTTAGDAIEACTLLGTAYQFKVAGTESAIRKALFQVFHRDTSVRKNVATVYKEIYLDNSKKQRSERQKALACAESLINLLQGLQPGQSPALTTLMSTWYTNKDVDSEMLQVLWEKFSMKSPDTTALESRSALMLITMIADSHSQIIIENLNVLVKVGLGPRAETDLLLARDTCRALLKIKQENKDIQDAPLRYENDHEMFETILTLLTDNFTNTNDNGYVSFATEAINTIYHLAVQPDHLMEQLLNNVMQKGQFMTTGTTPPGVSLSLLSRLLHLVGHIAIRQMVHLDTFVYKERKRRNAVHELKHGRKSKKNANMSSSSHITTPTSAAHTLRSRDPSFLQEEKEGEDPLEGAIDDSDAEFIHAVLENEIITGNGMLAKFVPLVLDVCQYPTKYNDEDLQVSATLALCKMMTVSSVFCEESLQLLVTILERSPHSKIRSSILIGLSDLATRFPNQVEPWTKHIYGRLRDTDNNVRNTCVYVLSTLILKEMIRVKGQVSELALCIVDDNSQIRQDTRELFKEISQKGNALYNVIPDILSRLADPELNLNEEKFQEIIRYILGLVQKEKQIDSIIEKICARFKLATTERQWRDLSYCLSLLQFSGKGIRHLIDSLPLLKDKIHNKHVMKALQNIIDQAKKKPELKTVCTELEEKIQELLEGNENSELSDRIAMPPPPPPTATGRKKTSRRARRKSSSEEEDDEELEPEEERRNDSDGDSETTKTPKARDKRDRLRKTKPDRGSSSDSDEDVPEKTPRSRTGAKKDLHSRRKADRVGATPSPQTKKTKPNKPTRSTRLSRRS